MLLFVAWLSFPVVDVINLIRKEGKGLILISKRESVELQKFGYKFSGDNSDGDLHRSRSRHPKYYLTESRKALNDLKKIRESHIIK